MTNQLPSSHDKTAANRSYRYPAQVVLLQRAVSGDQDAAKLVLQYLSSSITDLRRVMQMALHDWPHPRILQSMLNCLAVHRWELTPGITNEPDCERRNDLNSSKRIDQAIMEFFILDDNEAEKNTKAVILNLGLSSTQSEVRYASACLLGIRGNPQSLPLLDDAIKHGNTVWKLRAIHSLAALDMDQCSPPLLLALCQTNPQVHQAASRALTELGHHAKPALIEALINPDSHVRWHAARLLGIMSDYSRQDPDTIKILAEGMLDENQSVRWASASTLAEMGSTAVPAILDIIRMHPLTEELRQVIYHSLHAMPPSCRKKIKTLIEALNSSTTSMNAPAIASRLLLEVNYK